MNKYRENYRMWRLSILTIITCSVFVTTFLDPINWPKQIALVCLAPFLILEALEVTRFRIKESKWVFWSFVGSVTLMSISALATNESFTRTLWGTWGRNNGLITQISLFSVAFAFFLLAGFSQFKKIFLKGITLGMFPASIYGLVQFLGMDWISWSSKNQVFSFFGNTNFAASIFGITAITSLSLLLVEGVRSKLASIYVLQVFLSTFLAWQTKSIQGVVLICLAVILFVVTKTITSLQVPPFVSVALLSLAATLTTFGFLGKGPLGFLFQYTFELRSFYWTIGMRMGLDHPLFGVGVDSYGDSYRQYRTVDVAQSTTVDLTVNNAHNSLIQLFATTGILGLAAVLLWIAPAIFLSLKKITSVSKTNDEISLTILFLCSFAISMISIDNIAVAILHWALTGIVLRSLLPEKYVHNILEEKKRLKQNSNVDYLRPIIIPTIVGVAFIFSWSASSADRSLHRIFTTTASTSDQASINNRINSLMNLAKSDSTLQEAHLGYISQGLYEADVWPMAYDVATSSVSKFPLDFNLLDRAAMLAEKLGKFSEAENYRSDQLTIDPRHPTVWLYYARDLMEQGKIDQAKGALKKSYEFEVLLSDQGREYRKNLEEVLNKKLG
jgi:O-antigen ligase